MFKLFTIILSIFIIGGIIHYKNMVIFYERQIADIEYIIRADEHCVHKCIEIAKEWGC